MFPRLVAWYVISNSCVHFNILEGQTLSSARFDIAESCNQTANRLHHLSPVSQTLIVLLNLVKEIATSYPHKQNHMKIISLKLPETVHHYHVYYE